MTVCLPDVVARSFPARSNYSPIEGTKRILIIDRHPSTLLDQLPDALIAEGFQFETVCTGSAALQSILHDPPTLILLDIDLPDCSGFELHQRIRQIDPEIPVIFVSASAAAIDAIEAMKQGAYDYLFKPVQQRQFHRVLRDALQVARPRRDPNAGPLPTPRTAGAEGALRGRSAVMREVYKSIGRVAPQNVNVLVTGESGTGKELVARAIHRHSSRSQAPFLALNCAAIPENLLESEFFGHEKGAFSGADRRRVGKFEQCDGGTILLDEIGDMPLNLQAKILRLLQEQIFERVGGNETVHTNVRIIASTHRDLKARSAEGKFRADLFYRLSVFNIHLPALRERTGDLPILVEHFLDFHSREMGRQIREVSAEAMARLQRYHWPGNIRELQSVMKQAILRAHGNVLHSASLPELNDQALPASTLAPAEDTFDIDLFVRNLLAAGASDLYAKVHAKIDHRLLTHVLDHLGGNQQKAARLLGMARETLRLKLRELGLSVSHIVKAEDEVEGACPLGIERRCTRLRTSGSAGNTK